MHNKKKALTNRSNLFIGWWIFAIVCRILASITHAHWFHPDEWRQTIEPANLIAHGFGYHCQEFGLHLRNLTWPTLLAGILKLTHWISPTSIDVRIFGINLLCGLMDLGILWGWIQLLSQFSKKAQNWALALLLLPWFTLYESVNPKVEHLSEIAFWIALGCVARRAWFGVGLASVAIFAFRYPSILLSIGLIAGVLYPMLRSRDFRPIPKMITGTLTGIILFGLSDWIFYGRPWESFWMYLQYNLWTGSSTLVFGQQSVRAYLELFSWDWGSHLALVPLSVFLGICSIYGLWEGLKRVQPWALAGVVYTVGHLLVPHKEGRFMLPIETLTRWAAFVGAVMILKKIINTPMRRKITAQVAAVFLIVNGVIFLHALQGDLWKLRGTYRELGAHLQETPHVCAVLTPQEINSVLMPFIDGHHFPSPALGSYLLDENLSYAETRSSKVAWTEYFPLCGKGEQILLHVHKPETAWEQDGCTLLRSGVLRILPHSAWNWSLEKNLVDGPWYRCPPEILNHFAGQWTRSVFSKKFGKFESLPPWDITAQELENLGLQTSPPPPDVLMPSLAHPAY
jgi:phosphatidylinositol glycan class B